jgi:allophanate hydrolase subunit 1
MSSNSRNINQNATNASLVAADRLSELRTLEETLTGVNSVLARGDGEELSESELAQVLRELETADSVADGVESKLDNLLKNLEGMLDGLEGAEGGKDGKDEAAGK